MVLNFTVGLNILAILASGIASLVSGFIWYGPLFGKAWAGYEVCYLVIAGIIVTVWR